MFSTAAKNQMLNALDLAFASLHSGFPSQTGLNEISGGSPAYARQALTVNAASGEQRVMSTSITFNVPASTVRWVGFWNAAGTQFQGYTPNGGSPKEFIIDVAANTVRSPAHGYADGQKVVFYNGTVPGGLTEATVYFVRDAETNSFRVASTLGGTAIDLTSTGSSACLVSAIIEDVYAAQAAHTITTGIFALGF